VTRRWKAPQDIGGAPPQSAPVPELPGLPWDFSPSAADTPITGTGNLEAISSKLPASTSGGSPSRTPTHQTGDTSTPSSGSQGGGSGSAGSSGPDRPGGHSSGSGPRTPHGMRWSLRSVNYSDRYWRVRSDQGYLDPVSGTSSATTRKQAGFTVVPGLADSECHSFIAADGRYLRHSDFRLRLASRDGSRLFRDYRLWAGPVRALLALRGRQLLPRLRRLFLSRAPDCSKAPGGPESRSARRLTGHRTWRGGYAVGAGTPERRSGSRSSAPTTKPTTWARYATVPAGDVPYPAE
jgi:hypothetical protein